MKVLLLCVLFAVIAAAFAAEEQRDEKLISALANAAKGIFGGVSNIASNFLGRQKPQTETYTTIEEIQVPA
uniref:Antimicrobial peptide n=1 Tax=Euperipatoides rowelli TaxID=49087 RepID=D9IX78_EUPRO|nr:antimicrobial peptide [Euperipatoides rowelli]